MRLSVETLATLGFVAFLLAVVVAFGLVFGVVVSLGFGWSVDFFVVGLAGGAILALFIADHVTIEPPRF